MMKPEYDFSNAVRGKFYRPNAKFTMPVYLDDQILEFFTAQAELRGVDLSELLNDVLREDMVQLQAQR
jgi:hypothetical protein